MMGMAISRHKFKNGTLAIKDAHLRGRRGRRGSGRSMESIARRSMADEANRSERIHVKRQVRLARKCSGSLTTPMSHSRHGTVNTASHHDTAGRCWLHRLLGLELH